MVLLPTLLAAHRGSGTMKALTPAGLTRTRQVSPLTPLCLPDIPTSTTRAARRSLCQSPQRHRLLPGFAANEQAHHRSTPNQVRHPTDCRFISGCSPPRLTAAQLPSITELATGSDTDFHHANRASSRSALIPAQAGIHGTAAQPVQGRQDRRNRISNQRLAARWIPAFAHCCPGLCMSGEVHGRQAPHLGPKSCWTNMILRSAVPYSATAFQCLLEPLDRRTIARAVAAHDGDHGVGRGDHAWTCARHLKALLFAQVAGLTSLREIITGLAAHSRWFYHLNMRMPCRSTLSDANTARPAVVFRDIAMALIPIAAGRLRQEGEALIRLLDSSPI